LCQNKEANTKVYVCEINSMNTESSSMAITPVSQLSFDNTEIAFQSRSAFQLRKMYWLFKMMNNQQVVQWGTSLLEKALNWGLPVDWAIRSTIYSQFCGGVSIEDCKKTIQFLHQNHIGTILDYSVEGEKTEEGFDKTMEQVLGTIRLAENNPAIPFTVFKLTGVGSFDLMAKVQARRNLVPSERAAYQRMEERVETICQEAASRKVRLFFDGEETWIQQVIDWLCYRMMEQHNQETAIVWNTFQLYRWDMLPNLQQAYFDAQIKGYKLGAKLVRGAYMEKEVKRAKEMKYPNPIQPDKAHCDKDFDKAILFCLDHFQDLHFCVGTHNEASSMLLAKELDARGLAHNHPSVWFAQLLGMSDNLSFNLAKAGYNVAKYVPYGPVKAVMPYLTRRAQENTSIAGQTSRELQLVQSEMKRRASK